MRCFLASRALLAISIQRSFERWIADTCEIWKSRMALKKKYTKYNKLHTHMIHINVICNLCFGPIVIHHIYYILWS